MTEDERKERRAANRKRRGEIAAAVKRMNKSRGPRWCVAFHNAGGGRGRRSRMIRSPRARARRRVYERMEK